MKKYNLTTLSPVHVGSGKELLANSEFIYFANERLFAIISPEKVLSIIGEEHINQWVTIINNNDSLLEFLKRKKHDLKPEDIAQYTVAATNSTFDKSQNVREHMSTNGQPYLPGSSIKGSIRTAVLNYLIKKQNRPIDHLVKGRNGRVNDAAVLRHFFGPNANENSFRFIKVGDAHFKQSQLEIGQADLLNIYGRKADVKRGAGQLIEQLQKDSVAQFQLKIDDGLYIAKNKLGVETDFLKSYSQLEKIVNEHTQNMVANELMDLEDEFDLAQGKYDYMLSYLEQIEKEIAHCQAHGGMVLRLGFGIGWTFTTGGFVKNEKVINAYELQQEIEKAGRPNRRNKDYSDMPFPKTRKLAPDKQLLGFVKLTQV